MAPAPGDARTWMRRVPLVLARFGLDLVPIAAFAVISYGMIGFVRPLPTTELVLLVANNSYMARRAVMAGSRMLFSPASTHLRLVQTPVASVSTFSSIVPSPPTVTEMQAGSTVDGEDRIVVSVDVTNQGTRAVRETVQVNPMLAGGAAAVAALLAWQWWMRRRARGA
jgi:hypothetical protein